MPRNRKLPPGIRKRGDSYMVDVTLRGYRRTATASTLDAAKAIRIQMQAEMAQGRPEMVARWTWMEAYRTTYKTHWEGTRAEATTRAAANEFCEWFGWKWYVDDCHTTTLDTYVSWLKGKGNGPGTINRKLNAVSKMLTVVHERDGITKLPRIPRPKQPAGKLRWLSEGEEEYMLRHLMDRKCHENSPLFDAAIVLLDTGMRLGELVAVDPADVDVDQSTVLIPVSKADKARLVPLTKRAMMAMRGFIRSGPHSARRLRESWERARATLGPSFADVTLHTLRHTCASRLVSRGVPLRTVQEFLGHKSINSTLRYAHLDPSALDVARDALENSR